MIGSLFYNYTYTSYSRIVSYTVYGTTGYPTDDHKAIAVPGVLPCKLFVRPLVFDTRYVVSRFTHYLAPYICNPVMPSGSAMLERNFWCVTCAGPRSLS